MINLINSHRTRSEHSQIPFNEPTTRQTEPTDHLDGSTMAEEVG